MRVVLRGGWHRRCCRSAHAGKRKAAAGRLDVAVAARRTDGRGSAAVEAHQTSGRGGVGSPDGRTRRWRRLSGRPDAVASQWSSWCWCGTPWREGRPQQSGAKDLLRLVEILTKVLAGQYHGSEALHRFKCKACSQAHYPQSLHYHHVLDLFWRRRSSMLLMSCFLGRFRSVLDYIASIDSGILWERRWII